MIPAMILDLIRQQKLSWSPTDMPPMVIAESDDLLVIVTAPQVDEQLGFHAAEILRSGANAHTITIVMDARCSEDEVMEEDCLYIHCITEKGETDVVSLSYNVQEGQLKWHEPVDGRAEGYIQKRLLKLMSKPGGMQADVFPLLAVKGFRVSMFPCRQDPLV